MLKKDIGWIFSPPYGSHHGGVWEKCIRTTRKTLNALLKQQTLNDEALVTFMCEVESIINGRPIAKVSEDLRDLEPPTPNHLLLFKSGSVLPPRTFRKEDIFSHRRWHQVQYMADQFWRRWSKGLCTWRWGTPGRGGNLPRWGNPPVHIIYYFILIKFS